MKNLALISILVFATGQVHAQATVDRKALMDFIVSNRLDTNLYNLLAATIPSTAGGQAIFDACGSRVTEELFEKGYLFVRDEMGEVWREALADTYQRHLTQEELDTLSATPEGPARQTAIAERLSASEITEDLRANLSPLVEEATGRQLNSMLDEAEQVCNEVK